MSPSVNVTRSLAYSRAAPIMAGGRSTPSIDAAPRCLLYLLLRRPSPQPRSTTEGRVPPLMSCAKSQNGCSRSWAKRLYWSGSHPSNDVTAPIMSADLIQLSDHARAMKALGRGHRQVLGQALGTTVGGCGDGGLAKHRDAVFRHVRPVRN